MIRARALLCSAGLVAAAGIGPATAVPDSAQQGPGTPPARSSVPWERVVETFVLYAAEPAEQVPVGVDRQPPRLRWEVVGTEQADATSACEPPTLDLAATGASLLLTVIALDRAGNESCVHWPLLPQAAAKADLRWLEWTDARRRTPRVLLGWGTDESPIWDLLRVRERELAAAGKEFGRDAQRPRPQVFGLAPGTQPFASGAAPRLERGQVLKIAADDDFGVERLVIATSELPRGQVDFDLTFDERPAGRQESAGLWEVDFVVGGTGLLPAEPDEGGRVGVRFEIAGAPAVEMPDLVGLSLEAARQEIERLGLVIRRPDPASPPAGTVVGQRPTAGTLLSAGDEVELIVE